MILKSLGLIIFIFAFISPLISFAGDYVNKDNVNKRNLLLFDENTPRQDTFSFDIEESERLKPRANDFELIHYDDYNIDQALEWGRQQEAGKFGYSTTGIFSFADLVANFNGLRFWNKVLLKETDPLKGAFANFFDRPYITCDIQIIDSIKNRIIVKAWEFNTRLDMSDFVDGVWDEGNNCNSYDDPIIEEKVSARIKNVSPDFSCPLIADYCLAAQDKYGYYAKYVLHPYCLIVTKE